jgi:flagellar protein FliO/FliZ
MTPDPGIWMAFIRTAGMLVMVLAVMLGVLYLFRRLLIPGRGNRGQDLIQVVSVHHLSPREKLMLVKVVDQVILIGVTPSQISRIMEVDRDLLPQPDPPVALQNRFQALLARAVREPGPAPDKRAAS